jgi:hypothetical protein
MYDQCPGCKRKLRLPPDLLGKEVQCPVCDCIFTAAPLSSTITSTVEADKRVEEGIVALVPREEAKHWHNRNPDPLEREPRPIAGVEFHSSVLRSLLIAVGSIPLFILACAALSYESLKAEHFRLPFPQLGGFIRAAAIVVAIGIACVAPYVLFLHLRSIRRRPRLVVGDDRLQWIERRDRRDVVEMQIPFQNIISVAYNPPTDSGGNELRIEIRRSDDTETYARSTDFEANFKSRGSHVVMEGSFLSTYRMSLETIATTIHARMALWALARAAEAQIPSSRDGERGT